MVFLSFKDGMLGCCSTPVGNH